MIICQPVEFLPAQVSHNHIVYIIVTANCSGFLTYLLSCVENDVIVDCGPQIWPTQKCWRGAPYGVNARLISLIAAVNAIKRLNRSKALVYAYTRRQKTLEKTHSRTLHGMTCGRCVCEKQIAVSKTKDRTRSPYEQLSRKKIGSGDYCAAFSLRSTVTIQLASRKSM